MYKTAIDEIARLGVMSTPLCYRYTSLLVHTNPCTLLSQRPVLNGHSSEIEHPIATQYLYFSG